MMSKLLFTFSCFQLVTSCFSHFSVRCLINSNISVVQGPIAVRMAKEAMNRGVEVNHDSLFLISFCWRK